MSLTLIKTMDKHENGQKVTENVIIHRFLTGVDSLHTKLVLCKARNAKESGGNLIELSLIIHYESAVIPFLLILTKITLSISFAGHQ